MGSGLRVSITVSGLGRLYGDDLAGVVELAEQAEAAGIDQLVLPDHLAIGERLDRYPYGRFPLPPEEPWLEPLTTLAAMAGATRRIRLGTGVLIAPLRPALLLAKTVATLDVLSRGRVDLGVGVGWQPEEFAGAGVPFAGRTARLDDTLRACRALWSDAPASFASDTVNFDALTCEPRPVQAGGPPIWFGLAATPRHARRVAELGVGWLPMATVPGEIAAGIELLRAAFAAAGRDPAHLQVRANAPPVFVGGRPDLAATLAGLPALRAAGVTLAGFPLALFARERRAVAPVLRQIADGRDA